MRTQVALCASLARQLQQCWQRSRTSPRRQKKAVGRPETFETRTLLSINPIIFEETEGNNDSGTANALGVTADNTVVAVGTLPVGDRDFFSFTAPAGAKVWAYVDTGGGRNVTGTSTDSLLNLYTTDGVTIIQSDNDSGSGNGGDQDEESSTASVIAGRTVPAAGTYFIEVKPNNAAQQINPYKLFVAFTTTAAVAESGAGNNTSAVADPIGGATPIRSAQISPAGDVDFYSFTANAGDQVFIAVDGDPERDSTATDVTVSLIGTDGTQLMHNAIVNSGTVSEGVNFRLTTSGTYFVKIAGQAAATTGTYHVMVQVGSASNYSEEAPGDNNSSATAQLIPNLTTTPVIMTGRLAIGDRDFYSFTVPANSRLWAHAENAGLVNVAGSTVDTTLTLFTTDGATQLVFADDGASGTGDSQVNRFAVASGIAGRKLVAAGTYFLKIEDFSNNDIIDPYRLFLYVTPDTGTAESEGNNTAAVANPITAGGIKEGNIGAGDIDFYSIALKAGDIIWMSVNGDPEQDTSFTDVNLSLVGPDTASRVAPAAAVLNNSTNFESMPYRVTTAGTYFIRVAQQGASTGTYQLMTNVISATSNAAPVLDNSGAPYYVAGVGKRQSTAMTQGVLVTDILARGANGTTITDTDAGAVKGIAVTAIDKTYGKWQFSTAVNPTEADWTDIDNGGAVSDSSALLLKADANTRIRMTSTLIPHHEGTVAQGFLPLESKLTAGLTFRAWDQTSGTAGSRSNASINGGNTAFSTSSETLSTFFEARLWRSFNTVASLNVYTLEAEFFALTANPLYQDRATAAFTSFTVLLSPLTAAVPTAGMYRLYYGVQFNPDGTETDMGYRYLTTDLTEASNLEKLGPVGKQALRQGAYFRELGVNGGSAILGYIYTAAQPGTVEMKQVYRTDPVNKPTRPGGTPEGSAKTSDKLQEIGDHVYTTNTAVSTSATGVWRVEASRGFVRELSTAATSGSTPPPAPVYASSTSDELESAVLVAAVDFTTEPVTTTATVNVGLIAAGAPVVTSTDDVGPVSSDETPAVGAVSEEESAYDQLWVDLSAGLLEDSLLLV